MAPTLEAVAQPVSSLLWLCPLFSTVPELGQLRICRKHAKGPPFSTTSLVFKDSENKKGILQKPMY